MLDRYADPDKWKKVALYLFCGAVIIVMVWLLKGVT
jgi:hypothetical protein